MPGGLGSVCRRGATWNRAVPTRHTVMHMVDHELTPAGQALVAALDEYEHSVIRRSRSSRRTDQLHITARLALRFIHDRDRGGELCTPQRLATHLGISTATVTPLLDNLESAGRIQRSPNRNDRRSILIHPTGTLPSEIDAATADLRQRIVDGLSDDHATVIANFLRTLTYRDDDGQTRTP